MQLWHRGGKQQGKSIYTVEFAALVRTRSKTKPSIQYATQASSINPAHPRPRHYITAKIHGKGGGNGRKQGHVREREQGRGQGHLQKRAGVLNGGRGNDWGLGQCMVTRAVHGDKGSAW